MWRGNQHKQDAAVSLQTAPEKEGIKNAWELDEPAGSSCFICSGRFVNWSVDVRLVQTTSEETNHI